MGLTPSFYANLLATSQPSQLDSLLVCITGAEKAPQTLISNFKNICPKAKLIEGYGITECSPILCMQRFSDDEPKGVGHPLKQVEIMIVDKEDLRPLAQGEDGEILAHGPSIFKGYLEKDIQSPFVLINGKSYYRTGDFGHQDAEGNLFIKGRLKRFTKVGGEMVNLPLIEKVFTNMAIDAGKFDGIAKTDYPFVVIPIEKEGENPRLILMSTVEITIDEVNKILFESGFPRFYKLHHVVKVSNMPVLGSGKIHLKALTDLAFNQVP